MGQGARRSARRQASGALDARASRGWLRYPRSRWRRFAARVGGVDLPSNPVLALAGVTFSVDRGMIGVLGPNGSGKTTLLRQLAGVLDPTRGTITLGGVPLRAIQRYLARWVGYLPQDAGLPGGLTPREYLSYFAALYDLPRHVRRERVENLLEEVGLTSKTDEPIKALSRRHAPEGRGGADAAAPPTGHHRRRADSRARPPRAHPLSQSAESSRARPYRPVLDPRGRRRRGRLRAGARAGPRPSALRWRTGRACGHCQRRVWELRTEPSATLDLPAGAIRAEETPAADGSAVHRILAAESPDEMARPLEAGLEDGYLWAPLRGGRDSAMRRGRRGVGLLRLALLVVAGRRFWLLPFLPLLWLLFQAGILIIGAGEGFTPSSAQVPLVGLPLTLLAVFLGLRIIAGEIDGRSLEIAYTVPGGCERVWWAKLFASTLVLLASETLLLAGTYIFFTPLPWRRPLRGVAAGALLPGTRDGDGHALSQRGGWRDGCRRHPGPRPTHLRLRREPGTHLAVLECRGGHRRCR